MTRRHLDPRLNKKRVLTHADYTVYSVNGLVIRSVARPGEELGLHPRRRTIKLSSRRGKPTTDDAHRRGWKAR